jgi:hypothetical protein
MSEALEQVTQPITRDEPRDLAAMDGLDLLLLLALLPLHWALFFLVVFQWFVRRNPRLLAGLLRYVGAEHLRHNATAADLLPGLRQLPASSPAPNGSTSPSAQSDSLLHTLLDATPPPAPPATQPAAAASTTTPPPVLPWKQWRLQAVHAHHVLIIGNTDSGKTTLVRALLTGKRGAILAIDPKNRPGKWSGIAAIGLDDDAEYTRIDQAIQLVLAELRQRQKALNHGSTDFTPLTVVVDEAPDVADECPAFPTLFKRVGSVGRELHISLIVLSQRSTVRPLGIEGDGQARDNFTKILMGSFARRSVPALAGQRYCAVLDNDSEQHILDVSPLPTYARLPLTAHTWGAIQGHDQDEQEAAGGCLWLQEPDRTGTDSQQGALLELGTGTRTGSDTDASGHDRSDTDAVRDDISDDEVIRLLLRRGTSANNICRVIGGTRDMTLARVKRIRIALGMEEGGEEG